MKKDHICLKLDGEEIHESMDCVVEESPLSIFINGRHFVTAMTSPHMAEEFILGYLFTERIINGLSDVESLEIEGRVARLLISNPIKAIIPRKPIVSGCGGIATFLDESKLPQINSSLLVDKNAIYEAMKAIFESELHASTGGVHSVGLFDERGAVCICEDIGRHNALDKAIGFGLVRGLDFGKTFVASTGRISSEMALKCSVAGIPLIASRGATTSLALEIAERTGLTVIGFVRTRRMNIYTSCWRVPEHRPSVRPTS
ncbi:MAG: formate dehydrogenase accessory sulfurtransferase FdhD [Methanotrichaceae archaeon]